MPVVEEPADDKKKPDWEFRLIQYQRVHAKKIPSRRGEGSSREANGHYGVKPRSTSTWLVSQLIGN